MMLLALLLACGSPEVAETPATGPDSPAQMAELADEILAAPTEADRILKEAGLDRATFEKKLYEIAEDPEASRAFNAARK